MLEILLNHKSNIFYEGKQWNKKTATIKGMSTECLMS